jgi:hypothetical protein
LPFVANRSKDTNLLRSRQQNIVAQDLRPVASAFCGYRHILTISLKLRISRKIQLMGKAYFLLGDVENFVIFLPFLTLFGHIHAGLLFHFSLVLLRNRDPFQLPQW